MDRVILHADCNSFYASVECLYDPSIRNKPVVVGGDETQRHGIVLTKNQIAKKYEIKTGETIWSAKKKCPGLVVVPAHYDRYIHFSNLAHEIYSRYTDRQQPYGLDESWLDLTGNIGRLGDGVYVADELRRTFRKELGITISVGVSWNRIFAKLGSDYKKPDATTIFTRENYREKIWPLPAGDLLYVGPATARKLHNYGINKIGDIAAAPLSLLESRFGKWGGYLYAFANGWDTSPVELYGHQNTIKSIGNSMTTWRDAETPEEIRQVFLSLSESVARRLRENAFRCKTVQISLRNNELHWFECQMRLPQPACTVMALTDAAVALFQNKYHFTRPLRALGIRACDLIGMESGAQINFFADVKKQEQWEKIESCVDTLRGRFGAGAVKRASLLQADITGEADPLTYEVHPIGYFGN